MKDTDLAWMVPPVHPDDEVASRLDPGDEWVAAAGEAVDRINRQRKYSTGSSGTFVSLETMMTPSKVAVVWEGFGGVTSSWAPPLPTERKGHPLHSMAAFEAAYKLQGEVATGGFSNVHTCVRRRTGAVYAVKRMRASERGVEEKDIRAEAELMQRLDHPFVIHTIDAYYGANSSARPEVWLIEEYASGGELFRWCRRRLRPLLAADHQRLAYELLDGLSYLHAHGVIHRDIKVCAPPPYRPAPPLSPCTAFSL